MPSGTSQTNKQLSEQLSEQINRYMGVSVNSMVFGYRLLWTLLGLMTCIGAHETRAYGLNAGQDISLVNHVKHNQLQATLQASSPQELQVLVKSAHQLIAPQDTIKPNKYLIFDIATRYEVMVAVNAMYNFDFYFADYRFRWFQLKNPEHPMPYFLRGLNYWWQIMPDPDITKFDEKFEAYMDTTVMKAEKMYQADKTNMEAVFFLAAAYGFKGRLYSDRKWWRKATLAGRSAMEYMQISREGNSDDLGVEFLFGEGLYNYFSVWVAENYNFLRPVMFFFPKGDKKKGLSQLELVGRSAYYTRVEAQVFVTRIYASEEKRPADAVETMTYLHNTFPNNSFFHRYIARLYHSSGNWRAADKAANEIMARVDSNKVGYEAVTARYGTFILAYNAQFNYRDLAKAADWYTKCVSYTEQTEDVDSGYYLYSLMQLARMAAKDKQTEQAIGYYTKLEKYSDSKTDYHKEAKKFIKDNTPKSGLFGWF